MSTFDRLLNEALDNTSGVSKDEFINFAAAILSSTAQNNIGKAIEKAMALPPNELASIIKQIQYIGQTSALFNTLTKSEVYVTQCDGFPSSPYCGKGLDFLELGKRVLSKEDLQEIITELENYKKKAHKGEVKEGDICPYCGDEKLTFDVDDDGLLECPKCSDSQIEHSIDFNYCPNCDKWYTDDYYNEGEITWNNNEGLGECVNCSGEEGEYNAEADYYTQGDDDDGH